jgi:hypothetical protein
MMLMTDTQYRYVVTRKDRSQIAGPAADLSDADAATLYHSFDAQGGATRRRGRLSPADPLSPETHENMGVT